MIVEGISLTHLVQLHVRITMFDARENVHFSVMIELVNEITSENERCHLCQVTVRWLLDSSRGRLSVRSSRCLTGECSDQRCRHRRVGDLRGAGLIRSRWICCRSFGDFIVEEFGTGELCCSERENEHDEKFAGGRHCTMCSIGDEIARKMTLKILSSLLFVFLHQLWPDATKEKKTVRFDRFSSPLMIHIRC